MMSCMVPYHSVVAVATLLLAGYMDYMRNRVSDGIWVLGAGAHLLGYGFFGYRVTLGFVVTPLFALGLGMGIRYWYSIGGGDIVALVYLSTFTTLLNGTGVFLVALGISAWNMRRTWQPQPLVTYMAVIYIIKLLTTLVL